MFWGGLEDFFPKKSRTTYQGRGKFWFYDLYHIKIKRQGSVVIEKLIQASRLIFGGGLEDFFFPKKSRTTYQGRGKFWFYDLYHIKRQGSVVIEKLTPSLK